MFLHNVLQSHAVLKSVTPSRKKAVDAFLGERVIDLLWNWPTQTTIRHKHALVKECVPGRLSTLVVEVVKHERTPRMYRIICTDYETQLELIFFNPYVDMLQRLAPAGYHIAVSGRVDQQIYKGTERWQMIHPDHIGPPNTAKDWLGTERIYPLTAKLNQGAMRVMIDESITQIHECDEWIHPELCEKENWPTWAEAMKKVHSPEHPEDLTLKNPARARLVYDEFLAQQVTLQLSRSADMAITTNALPHSQTLQKQFSECLPFQLTEAQKGVVHEIAQDMSSGKQMLRLLQGDVGSGKTVVAIMAMLQALEHGYQAALMVPTDILARQHFQTLQKMLEPMGIQVGLLTAREKAKQREETIEKLRFGKLSIAVGTHAIFQSQVQFHKLGLIVIDEQHRFGVEQRLALSSKGQEPHILSMTATPIPRTLTLVGYGDMDVSLLKEKPKGRQPVATKLVSMERLNEVIQFIDRAIKQNKRVYWICPLIEESEKLELTAVMDRYDHLLSVFQSDDIALVHGKLKADEKEEAMRRFSQGEAKVLIATTVIEVGVDVPEATIMVIEHAENFGLAQLHQLRGRVGRGSEASTCLLLYGQPLTALAKKRLETLRASDDGFDIAEADLRLRGGGDVLGTKQSGMHRFRLVDLATKDEDEQNIIEKLLTLAQQDAKFLCHHNWQPNSKRRQAIERLLELFEHAKSFEYQRSG